MDLPKKYVNFFDEYPEIAAAYENLGKSISEQGKFDTKTRALVKLALSAGSELEGGVHAHVRKALEAGVEPDEIREIALLAITTLGFPKAMKILTWIEDIAPGK